MKLDRFKARRWLMVLLILGVFGVFVARLMEVQIIHADDYRRDQLYTSVQTVKATRGEIVDRNGVSLVSNTLGYDVIIDKAFFPKERQNEILLRLITLFENAGEEWNDNLPISFTRPYTFLPGYDSEIAILKTQLKVQSWATEEDTMFRLLERYDLTDYASGDARKVAGVRYEMERRGFATNVPYTFATDIDIQLVLKIKERNYMLSGVDVIESAIRHFDIGDIAPHLIGQVGPIYAEEYPALKEKGYAMDDTVGKSGVESAFEDSLRGKNGERDIVTDASGQVVGATETQPPVPGNTVVLTIDSNLQREAQLALEAQIKYLQRTAPVGQGREANAGAVVAIHVPTGQVLAAATYPSFDLNTYLQNYASLAADAGHPLYNRALQGLYAPGSTFKPVVGTAGLATGVITETSTVFCGHVYTRFKDYQPKCLGSHGNITLGRALSLSCNIFFYDTGWNAGIDAIDKFSSQYGLGEPTGIELYEEIGHRSNKEVAAMLGQEWNGGGDVLQTSIGQLYNSFTPLQLANYAATVANRGKRMNVTIVKEIQDYARKNVIQSSSPTVAQAVETSPENFEAVIRGMVQASRTGSARAHFANYPVDVAAKTGTPESAAEPNSTFICFAPAQNPQIAVAVVIEKGWHGYTGAPVAKALLDMYFGYDNPNPLVPKGESGQENFSSPLPSEASGVAETESVSHPDESSVSQTENQSSSLSEA